MSTKRVIEFKQGDTAISVEVEDELPRGDQLSSRGAVEKARQSFEEAVAGIGPIAATIMRQVTCARARDRRGGVRRQVQRHRRRDPRLLGGRGKLQGHPELEAQGRGLRPPMAEPYQIPVARLWSDDGRRRRRRVPGAARGGRHLRACGQRCARARSASTATSRAARSGSTCPGLRERRSSAARSSPGGRRFRQTAPPRPCVDIAVTPVIGRRATHGGRTEAAVPSIGARRMRASG